MFKNPLTKKIIVIISVLIITVIGADYLSYLHIYNTQKVFLKETNLEYINLPKYMQNRFVLHDHSTMDFFENNPKSLGFRKPVGTEYKKKPIWLFGCSFAYGADMTKPQGVADDENFGYFLSKAAKRPVYNRANPSWGIQHMLYQLERPQIYNDLPEPEYVIFLFISDHARRMIKITYDVWNNGAYTRYKLDKNGKLKEVKPLLEPMWNFYFMKAYFYWLEYSVFLDEKNFDKNFDLMKAMFIKSKELINEKYPNAKFVILKYDEINGFERTYYDSDRWKEIENAGITVIDAGQMLKKDLKAKEYVCDDNYHPSQKAYKEIAEKLAKKL